MFTTILLQLSSRSWNALISIFLQYETLLKSSLTYFSSTMLVIEKYTCPLGNICLFKNHNFFPHEEYLLFNWINLKMILFFGIVGLTMIFDAFVKLLSWLCNFLCQNIIPWSSFYESYVINFIEKICFKYKKLDYFIILNSILYYV